MSETSKCDGGGVEGEQGREVLTGDYWEMLVFVEVVRGMGGRMM